MSIFENYQMTIGMFVIPMGAGMFLYRDLLTSIMLGSQWMICAGFIGIYSLVHSLAIITNSFFSEMYRALGKPRVSMIAQLIHLIYLIPIIYTTAHINFNTLCIGTAFAVLGFMCEHFIIVKVILKKKIGRMLVNIGTIFIPTAVMSLFASLIQKVNSGVVWQFISIILCVFVYFFSLICIRPLRENLKTSELTSDLFLKMKSCIIKIIK